MRTPYQQAVEAACRQRHSTRFDTPTIAYACDECRETVAAALPHLLAPIEALAYQLEKPPCSCVSCQTQDALARDLRAVLASIKEATR